MANASPSPQFIGRVEETKAIIDAIEKGENVFLYGERGIGKTSLVEHVGREIKDVFFCSTYTMGLPKNRFLSQLQNNLILHINHIFYESDSQEFINLTALTDDNNPLLSILNKVSDIVEKERIVYCLDGFEWLLSNITNREIESVFRDFFEVINAFDFINVVITSDLPTFLNIKNHNIYDIGAQFKLIKLQSFSASDAKQYIENKYSEVFKKLNNDTIKYIVDVLGVRSPYELDLLLRDIDKVEDEKLNIEYINDTILPEVARTLHRYGGVYLRQLKQLDFGTDDDKTQFNFAHRLLRRMSCVEHIEYVEITNLASNYGVLDSLEHILDLLIQVGCLVKQGDKVYCLPSQIHKSYWYVNDVTAQDRLPVNLIGDIHLAGIQINNIKCLENIELLFDEQNKNQMILGTNAKGKTTILQLIALGLSGAKHVHVPNAWQNVVREGCDVGEFCIDVVFENEPTKLCFEIDEQDYITCTKGAKKLKEMSSRFILCGYGVHRHIKLQDPYSAPVFEAAATLFNDDTHLKHIKVSENYRFVLDNFETIRDLVNEVLSKGDLDKPTSLVSFDEKNFYFESATGKKLGLYSLSEGFKSTFAWLFDFIMRVVKHGGDLSYRKRLTGVVLLDEVDLHLHPSWQRTILPSLELTFPKIQFIVTTHSPFVAQSVNRGQIARLQWQGEHVEVCYEDTSDELSYESIAHDIFGIKSPFSQRTANDLEEYRHLQLAIRKGEDVDLESFKELVIDISNRGEELHEVMRNSIHDLQQRTGLDFGLWKS